MMKQSLRPTTQASETVRAITPPHSTEVTNPCPVCHNSTQLVKEWRPEKGYDRRMRQFQCILGHQHYRTPRHSSTTLEPPS